MKIYDHLDLKEGWIVGDFEPSIFKNEHVAVAHHFRRAGHRGDKHTHKVATELTYVISGRVIASGQEFGAGEIFIYSPGEIADVRFLEHTDLIVIKWPSVPDDKYMMEDVKDEKGTRPWSRWLHWKPACGSTEESGLLGSRRRPKKP